MTRPYTDYKNKMLGKRVDYDGWLGYQCVDLMKSYCGNVLWLDIHTSGNANQAWRNVYKIFNKDWQQIKGTNDLMQGDIIFSINGDYWHVAIVDSISFGKIYVLEQNGSGKNSGSGTGANAIRVKDYPFSFWVGVWRCKKIFDNLQIERAFVDNKLKTLKVPVADTVRYRNSLRWLVK